MKHHITKNLVICCRSVLVSEDEVPHVL